MGMSAMDWKSGLVILDAPEKNKSISKHSRQDWQP